MDIFYAVPVSDFTFVSRFSSLLSIVFSWFNKIFHLLYYCCCLFLLWTEWIHIGISNPPSGITEARCWLAATDPACYWLTFLQEVKIIWKLLLVCAQFYPIYWSWFYNSRPVFVCFFHYFDWLMYGDVIPTFTSCTNDNLNFLFLLWKNVTLIFIRKSKNIQHKIILLPDESSTTVCRIY